MVISISEEISMSPIGKRDEVTSNCERNFRILPVLAVTMHQGQTGIGKAVWYNFFSEKAMWGIG